MSKTEWSDLADIYEHGLAKSTWSNYSTAERLLAKCCKEKGIKQELPVKENTVLAFIHWMAFHRGAKAGTIRNYLAGIRQLHIAKGISDLTLCTERTKTMLNGLKNKEMAKKRAAGAEKRKPITPDILRLLKTRLTETDMRNSDKKLLWTVSSVLFHGAFRVHEILSKSEKQFDPDYCLLEKDAMIRSSGGEKVLQLKIKAPKEDKLGASTIIDIYPTDNDICPVRAFQKWWKRESSTGGRPLFCFNDGTPLTGRRFNSIIRECLGKGFPEGVKLFSSHSFRAGAASMMGELGFSDEDVKSVGRWNSRAFLEYIKLPRTRRAEIAKVWAKKTH